MEIIDNNTVPENRNNRPRKDGMFHGKIYMGIILIVMGALWLFYNFRVISPHVFDIFFSWQMLLVVIGGYLIAIRKYTGGVIIAAIGMVTVFLDIFNVYVSISKVILPAVVIALGVSILLSINKK